MKGGQNKSKRAKRTKEILGSFGPFLKGGGKTNPRDQNKNKNSETTGCYIYIYIYIYIYFFPKHHSRQKCSGVGLMPGELVCLGCLVPGGIGAWDCDVYYLFFAQNHSTKKCSGVGSIPGVLVCLVPEELVPRDYYIHIYLFLPETIRDRSVRATWPQNKTRGLKQNSAGPFKKKSAGASKKTAGPDRLILVRLGFLSVECCFVLFRVCFCFG